jgi:hypothetical protein
MPGEEREDSGDFGGGEYRKETIVFHLIVDDAEQIGPYGEMIKALFNKKEHLLSSPGCEVFKVAESSISYEQGDFAWEGAVSYQLEYYLQAEAGA